MHYIVLFILLATLHYAGAVAPRGRHPSGCRASLRRRRAAGSQPQPAQRVLARAERRELLSAAAAGSEGYIYIYIYIYICVTNMYILFLESA